MAQVKIYSEPEMELLTVFWQAPRKNQLCTELGNGIILIIEINHYVCLVPTVFIGNNGFGKSSTYHKTRKAIAPCS